MEFILLLNVLLFHFGDFPEGRVDICFPWLNLLRDFQINEKPLHTH